MSFRISPIHDYNRFIAIDLGSYRIRAGLYRMEGGELILEGSSIIRQSRKNMIDGTIVLMQGVAEALEKAIHDACRETENIPDDIIISFTPSICIEDMIASQYIREDSDHALTMDDIDTMVEKIEQSSLLRMKEKAKTEYGVIHDDIRLISSTLTSIVIDGRTVMNPVGITGKHVRINVLNVYALASEYNMLRSVVSSLRKRTISIVPTPILFSKILETSSHAREDNIVIEIGYSHITLLVEKKGEIIFFDTLARGVNMLIEMLEEVYPKASYTELESLLVRSRPIEEDRSKRESVAHEYFQYIIDILLSVMVRHNENFHMKTIWIAGSLFSSQWIEKKFYEVLSENLKENVKLRKLDEITQVPSELSLVHGLSLLARELLHTKKDPIIRILRYTLYHYE